jgi:hypothetical protein
MVMNLKNLFILLLRPSEFFQNLDINDWIKPIFYVIIPLIGWLLTFGLAIIEIDVMKNIDINLVTWGFYSLKALTSLILQFFAFVLIVHLLLYVIRCRKSVGITFKILSFAQVPFSILYFIAVLFDSIMLFSYISYEHQNNGFYQIILSSPDISNITIILPFLLVIIGFIWMIYVAKTGISKYYDLHSKTATFIVGIPAIIFFAYYLYLYHFFSQVYSLFTYYVIWGLHLR